MTGLRSAVILVIVGLAQGLSAQSDLQDTFRAEHRKLTPDSSCQEAVEVFRIVDSVVIQAPNTQGRIASARALQDGIQSKLESLGKTRPRIRITEIPNEHQRRTLFVVYGLWVIGSATEMFSSVRVFVLGPEGATFD
jgi:hypothetical protein